MFNGKTALVTGSTGGIGLGIARAYAAQGANIVLNGFGDAVEIEQIRAGIASEHGVAVRYDGADMSKPDAIEMMMGNAIEVFGGIDILVNNAGIQHVAPIDEFPVGKWDTILAINLSASFHAVRRVRWQAGYADAKRMIRRAPWQHEVDPTEGVIIHDAATQLVPKLAQGVDGFSGRTR